jgi:tetratricopeptide (TPR) repeat protein
MILRHREMYGGEHMRAVGLAVLAIVAFLLEGTAAAQDRDRQWNSCVLYDERGKLRTETSPDLAIGACTAIIQSGQETTQGLARAFNNRGIAYRDKRDYDRAIQDLDEAIRLDPNNAFAFNNRCFARAIVNRFQGAVADCNESLRLRPGYGNALESRGLAYLKLKKLDLALADYDAALEVIPKNAFSLYGRGMTKWLKRDKAGANADIAAAKQISPDVAEDFERYGVPAP